MTLKQPFVTQIHSTTQKAKAYHHEKLDTIARLSLLVFWASQSQVRSIGKIKNYINVRGSMGNFSFAITAEEP